MFLFICVVNFHQSIVNLVLKTARCTFRTFQIGKHPCVNIDKIFLFLWTKFILIRFNCILDHIEIFFIEAFRFFVSEYLIKFFLSFVASAVLTKFVKYLIDDFFDSRLFGYLGNIVTQTGWTLFMVLFECFELLVLGFCRSPRFGSPRSLLWIFVWFHFYNF